MTRVHSNCPDQDVLQGVLVSHDSHSQGQCSFKDMGLLAGWVGLLLIPLDCSHSKLPTQFPELAAA